MFAVWWGSILAKLTALKPRSKTRRRAKSPRLSTYRIWFEPLEDRLAPATRNWTGLGVDANWSTAGNWDTAPVNGDTIVFAAGQARMTNTDDLTGLTLAGITISAGGYTINSGAAALTLTGGAAALNVTAATGITSIGEVISGTGGLTKTGACTLIAPESSTAAGWPRSHLHPCPRRRILSRPATAATQTSVAAAAACCKR